MRALAPLLGGLAALTLLLGLPAIARHEQNLQADEPSLERAMMYELLPGKTLSVPLDAGADVARIVARGFVRRGAPQAGSANVSIELGGANGSRREQLTLPLSSREPTSRSEDGEVTAGDRTALNVDTSGSGPGSLTLTLDELHGADGLLVRFYAREALDDAQRDQRRRTLSARERRQLARQAGDVDWADLEPEARAALLTTHYRKLAALPDAEQALVLHVLAWASDADDSGKEPRNARPRPDLDEPAGQICDAATATRLTPERGFVVDADGAPLVLRLRAERPSDASGDQRPARLRVEISAPHAALRKYSVEAGDKPFHVLVPALGRALITPQGEELDVSLSELDPDAAPRPVRLEGSATVEPWRGFLARRPSNFAAFEPQQRRRLACDQVPETPASGPRPFDPWLARARPLRPRAASTRDHDGRLYVSGATSLSIDVPSNGAVVPLRLLSTDEVEVTVLIDGGEPQRRVFGVPRFVTSARTLKFRGETAFGIVLGDDLQPGRHTVSLRYAAGVKVWLNAPWRHTHAPLQSSWLAGGFEP